MKLRIINKKGEEEVINVQFWSFFKCWILSWLMIFPFAFLLGIILAIIGLIE